MGPQKLFKFQLCSRIAKVDTTCRVSASCSAFNSDAGLCRLFLISLSTESCVCQKRRCLGSVQYIISTLVLLCAIVYYTKSELALLQVDAPEEVDALPHFIIAPIDEVPKPYKAPNPEP